MKKVFDQLIPLLKKELGFYLGISFGIAFFVFIFKPFPIENHDDDLRKLFNIGIGIIVFLSMFLVRDIYPCLVKKNSQSNLDSLLFAITSGFFIWFINVVAISCYIHIAASLNLSLFILFKILLISLGPPVILRLYDNLAELKHQNELLIQDGIIMQKNMDENDEDNLHKSIEFISEKKSEKFSLKINEILYIKTADNYVEIHFFNGAHVQKKMVRNTLKNIELQISPYPEFVRCHRTCIINSIHIEKLTGNCNHHKMILKGYNELIPVSRRYYLKVKEVV